MNLRIDQLASSLGSLKPVYLVSGDEPLQIMEASDLIRAACREQAYDEREVFDVDASFDWQLFNEEAASMSLFASRRVLDVRLPSAKPGKQGSQAIKHYLDKPPPDTILLITSGKLDKNAKNSAWFKAIDKQGVSIQCWPVAAEQLHGWVRQRFISRDMQPDKEVVDYVCQHVEGNLLAAAQEIDKLQLLIGLGELGLNSVKEMITENSRYSVFELADTALQGDQSRAMKVMNSLATEGLSPQLVLWALGKEIRLLASVAAEPSSAEYSLKRSGVWQNRMNMFKACLSRHNERSFCSLLQRCAKIEGISKGFEAGNTWDELRMLVYLLAAGSGRGR